MPKLMNRKQAAEYLGISGRTMCELTRNREIAYHQRKSGGAMQFDQEDLDRYIASTRVPTLAEQAAMTVLPGGSTLRKRRAVG